MTGAMLVLLALAGAGFYTAWWGGMIYFLNPDDAVRFTALAVALAFFLVVGFIGYVMYTTKPPKPYPHSKIVTEEEAAA